MGLLFSTNENWKVLETCGNILEDGTFKSSPARFEQQDVLFGNCDRTVQLVLGLFSGKAPLLTKTVSLTFRKKRKIGAEARNRKKTKTDYKRGVISATPD